MSPTPGHNHGTPATSSEHTEHTKSTTNDFDPFSLADLLPNYFAVHSSLAEDDLETAKTALKAMMETTGHSGALSELIHQMLDANTLDAIRRPHFEILSNIFIGAVSKNSPSIDKTIYQMKCPMVYPDRGADWLQDHDQLLNPYFGSSMLHCGEIKNTY